MSMLFKSLKWVQPRAQPTNQGWKKTSFFLGGGDFRFSGFFYRFRNPKKDPGFKPFSSQRYDKRRIMLYSVQCDILDRNAAECIYNILAYYR